MSVENIENTNNENIYDENIYDENGNIMDFIWAIKKIKEIIIVLNELVDKVNILKRKMEENGIIF